MTSDGRLDARIVLGAEPGAASDSYAVSGDVPALDELVRHLRDMGYRRARWEPLDIWSEAGRDAVRAAFQSRPGRGRAT